MLNRELIQQLRDGLQDENFEFDQNDCKICVIGIGIQKGIVPNYQKNGGGMLASLGIYAELLGLTRDQAYNFFHAGYQEFVHNLGYFEEHRENGEDHYINEAFFGDRELMTELLDRLLAGTIPSEAYVPEYPDYD